MDLLFGVILTWALLENILSVTVTFKRLINVPRYTSSSLAFAMNATDHINVVFRKSAHSLMSRVTASDFLTDCCEWLTWLDEIGGFGQLGRRDFLVPTVFISTFIPLLEPSSPVSLSYFNFAVLMRKCSGEHSTFSIAILNGTCSFKYKLYDMRLFGITPKPQ